MHFPSVHWTWYLAMYIAYALVEGVLTARERYRNNPSAFLHHSLSKLLPYIVWAPLYTLERIFGCFDWIAHALNKAVLFLITFGNTPGK